MVCVPMCAACLRVQLELPARIVILGSPSALLVEARYKMKYIKLSSGTLVPAIGLTVQF